MPMINIAITGASGRMGRALVQAVSQSEGLRLTGATERAGSAAFGADLSELAGVGRLGVIIRDRLDGLDSFDVLVDFTRPDATLGHLEFCRTHKRRLVIGTTGFDAAGKKKISEAAKDIGIVFAPNMSVGVNLCFKLLETAGAGAGRFRGYRNHRGAPPPQGRQPLGHGHPHGRGRGHGAEAESQRLRGVHPSRRR